MGQVLNYHKVTNDFEWGITRVTCKQFESHCKFFAENGYKSLTFSEFCEFGNTNEKYFAITFDDAYKNVYENAFPILKKFGFKATVFVITDFIGEKNLWDVNLGWKVFPHLNEQEIIELSESGWEIGSHTKSHKALIYLKEEQIKLELGESKNILERLVKKKFCQSPILLGFLTKKFLN